jgi:fatty-acyl-CoA synthase
MMDYPLSANHFLERAAALFGGREGVSQGAEVSQRHRWQDVHERTARLRAVLTSLGVRPGQRVATLGWNDHRHLEIYFAVPGVGAVLHTVNVRLSAEQVARILAHAESEVIFAGSEFVSLVDEAAADLPGVRARIVLDGEAPDGWQSYEDLLAGEAFGAPLAEVEENAAAGLCYTSGTTGEPKGVLYSHRALALHTMAICLPDGFNLGEVDTILPAVPMFHANAWGLPYAAAMTGAGLVLPGPRPSAERIAELLEREQVTFAAGVPTVWMGVLEELRRNPRSLAAGLRIHSGGAPSPAGLIEAYRTELGVEIVAGWGMTELTPVGMVTHPRARMAHADAEELLSVRMSQGTPLPFVEARVVNDAGEVVPHDGETPGELEVRGPWVTAGYFRSDSAESFRDGWLRTGDVATIDVDGYTRLVDRTKDLIRSGGEWISSVRVEHALMDVPGVAEAAVVAVPDDKWGERPWACVVVRAGASLDEASLLGPLHGLFPSWWMPDGVSFVAALPRTATGKFDKKVLRERLRDSGRGDRIVVEQWR